MTRITQSSFTRGELTPRLDARVNLEQRELGLRSAQNAIIHQEGGISNRMGLEFVDEAKTQNKQVRLIKFVFNLGQTYMLEFSEFKIRIIHDGGFIAYPSGHAQANQIIEVSSPYEAQHLSHLKYCQSGDVLTLTHPDYPPKNFVRYSHYDWRLENIQTNPSIAAPTNATATHDWGSNTNHTNTKKYHYVVTAVDTETNEESEKSNKVTKTARREASWQADETITISWNEVSGAGEYNVYKEVNNIYGYIGSTTGTSFVDDNIEPDLTSTVPELKYPFANGNNPSCSAYFQQRKMYANSNTNPQTLWSSRLSAINNFSVSRPLVATDAVTVTLDDREMNEIRHLVPMKDLIVFTTNSEWKLNGTDGVFQASPVPAAVVQSNFGASHVQPIVSGQMVIFVQAGGSVIRDLGWDTLSDGYTGNELSIFSNHLFEGKEVKYIAYAKEPYRLVWVVFTDGTCAAMVYNKEQKLCGWTRQVTSGKFESVEVIREGMEDVAYFVINRLINPQYDGIFSLEYNADNEEGIPYYAYNAGDRLLYSTEKIKVGTVLYSDFNFLNQYGTVNELIDNRIIIGGTWKKYIERTKTRIIEDAAQAFLVDCGLYAEFENPVTHISGLEHLEGREVICNVNGGIIDGLIVNNGSIDLPKEAHSIVVGLPYTFDFETLPVEGENTQGLMKTVNYVSAKIYKSREDFIFVGADGFEHRNSRCDDSINNTGMLFNKDIANTVFSLSKTDTTIHIKQDYPLPLTLLSVSATVDVQDPENG